MVWRFYECMLTMLVVERKKKERKNTPGLFAPWDGPGGIYTCLGFATGIWDSGKSVFFGSLLPVLHVGLEGNTR